MKEKIVLCYFIYSQKVYRFHGDHARTVSQALNIDTHYVYGILACDVYDFCEAKEKLAKNGIFAKRIGDTDELPVLK